MDTLELGGLIQISFPLLVIIFHLLFPKSKKQSKVWLWWTGIIETGVCSFALWLGLQGVEQISEAEGVGKALAGGSVGLMFGLNFIVVWVLVGYRLIAIPKKVPNKENETPII